MHHYIGMARSAIHQAHARQAQALIIHLNLYSTVQYSTVQCSQVQYSTMQYSSIQEPARHHTPQSLVTADHTMVTMVI